VVAAGAGPLWGLNVGRQRCGAAPRVCGGARQTVPGAWPKESIAEIALSELREQICSAARRRGTEHAEAGEGFELEKMVSCSSDGPWRRTKLDLGGGEPLDNHHWPTTLGTTPKFI
jgi:hypothetical protein